MLHLLCMGRVALTSVAGGAALSYNQLAETNPAGWASVALESPESLTYSVSSVACFRRAA
jgi:surfactin synthase thioesterase subunit